MNDDELAELLRRTLRHRAADIEPSPIPQLHLVDPPRSRRVRTTYVISGLVAAALVAAVAAAIAINSPGRTHLTVDTVAPANAAITTPTAPPPKPIVIPTTTTTTIPPIPEYPVPADFSPVSVTFVSAYTGWVLGTASCQTGECAYLVRTTDGGASWQGVPAPPGVSLTDPQTGRESGDLVRFANLEDGWIVAPGLDSSRLFATYDGGRDWQPITLPGAPSGAIDDLEASNGRVHAVVSKGSTTTIFSSSVYDYGWTESGTMPGADGAATITLQGSSGWILQDGANAAADRLSSEAATAGSGSVGWSQWSSPCVRTPASGVLAASSPADLSAVCETVSQAAASTSPSTTTQAAGTTQTSGSAGTPAQGGTAKATVETLYQSTDQGNTFTSDGPLPAGQLVSAAAQPAGVSATVVAATSTGLVATFDGGQTWQTVYSGGAVGFVGFTTSRQGVAIASGTVLMTFDGGHTWHAVGF